MARAYSRREALQWAGGAAMATALHHVIERDASKPMGRSSGGRTLVLDDIKRSLTQLFGGSKGKSQGELTWI